MQASRALYEFNTFLTDAAVSLNTLTPTQAIDVMLQFYMHIRAEEHGRLLDLDDDMLLFQWGVYDWGKGEFFEYNLTRQLIYTQVVPPDSRVPGDEEETEEDIIGYQRRRIRYRWLPCARTRCSTR